VRSKLVVGSAALVALAVAAPGTRAGVGVSVGVRVGGPRCYRPVYPVGIYYRPAPVYVAPPPVVVAPVPVYRPVTVVEQVYSPPAPVTTEPPLQPVAAQPVARAAAEDTNEIDRNLRLLVSADDRTRADAALQLGRLRSRLAVQPLIRLLTTDRSPAVRDAAARALGLIGDSAALDAVQTAAGADQDRDVRRSAEFAAEVLRANYRR
jgi:hypothetical protein